MNFLYGNNIKAKFVVMGMLPLNELGDWENVARKIVGRKWKGIGTDG